jgi:protein-disulfide isomerase
LRLLAAASLLLFSLAAYCRAQSQPQAPPDAALIHRVEVMIRDKFNLPPDLVITTGTRTPSPFNGYDNLPVTLSYQGKSQQTSFLLSADGTRLVQMNTYDLVGDPVFHIDIAGHPLRGNPNAKVTVVNFDDLECPYCAELYKELFTATFARYGNQVRFVYLYFPLARHPWALHAAVDANCLAGQNGDTYWNYVDYLHRHVDEIAVDDRDIKKSYANLDRIARQQATASKLDGTKLDACLALQDQSPVQASMAEASTLGIHQVPTLYVNGERIDGALPENQIWAVIDRALKAEGETPPSPPAPSASH